MSLLGLFLAGPACTRCDSSQQPAEALWQVQKRQSWHYLTTGDYGRYISDFRACYSKALAQGDTTSALFSCAYMAQAYIFSENADSAAVCLRMAQTAPHAAMPPQFQLLMANTRGLYAVKFDMDLTEALEAFQQGYEIAARSDIDHKVSTQISFLVNMCNIFYARNDPQQGMEWANRALQLMSADSVSSYDSCLVMVSAAMMRQLSGHWPGAMSLVRQADSLSLANGFKAAQPDINLLYANDCLNSRNYAQAQHYYQAVLADSAVADAGTMCLALLNYGKLLESTGRKSEAIARYRQGMAHSLKFKNSEFLQGFYHQLSHLLYEAGQNDDALACYNAYWHYLDSVSPLRQEQRISGLMRSYQRARYDNALQRRELELMQSRRRGLIAGFVVALLALVTGGVLLLLRRQRAMYRTLYVQHQHYLHSLDATNAEPPSSDQDRLEPLFRQIEQLMLHDKVYRQNDLSLVSLAERLNTNKTYVSAAINRYAGKPFRDYVASLRINDAVRIISDPEDETPLKLIADELGFNSVSVFTKTFLKETGLPPGQYRREARKRE